VLSAACHSIRLERVAASFRIFSVFHYALRIPDTHIRDTWPAPPSTRPAEHRRHSISRWGSSQFTFRSDNRFLGTRNRTLSNLRFATKTFLVDWFLVDFNNGFSDANIFAEKFDDFKNVWTKVKVCFTQTFFSITKQPTFHVPCWITCYIFHLFNVYHKRGETWIAIA